MHRGGPLVGLTVCDQGQSLASSASTSGTVFVLRIEPNSSKMSLIGTRQLDLQVIRSFRDNIKIWHKNIKDMLLTIDVTGRRMRCRSSVSRFRLAIGSCVCLIIRIAGGLGPTMSRHNVALRKRFEARSHHVVLRKQSSAMVDPRHELGYPHLLGLEVPTADNEYQASNR